MLSILLAPISRSADLKARAQSMYLSGRLAQYLGETRKTSLAKSSCCFVTSSPNPNQMLISAQFNAFKEYRPEGILLRYLQGYDFTIKPFHSSYLGIGCYISYY